VSWFAGQQDGSSLDKSAIPDVAEVNLAQKGVRFAHPSKNPNSREPQYDSSDDAPPLHYCKNEHCGQNRENQHEFPVAAEQKIRRSLTRETGLGAERP